jgi:hypothetical protein
MLFATPIANCSRPLAAGLAATALLTALGATAQDKPATTTGQSAATATVSDAAAKSKSSAKPKGPPPELSGSRTARQPEVIPRTTVPSTIGPRVIGPSTTAPSTIAPSLTAPRTTIPRTTIPSTTIPGSSAPLSQPLVEPQPMEEDYVIVDDYGSYGPGMEGYEMYGGYGGGNGNNYSRGPLWVQGEYILWWVEGFRAPALVTTSPVGTPQADAGILGLPSTTVLFGDRHLADQQRHGARLTVGAWFNEPETTGIQVSGFWLYPDHHNFSATSADFPILARPFFNVEPGFEGPDAELVAFPGLFEGQISVRGESSLLGGEAMLRQNMCGTCYCRVDGLLGARYTRLDESLVISDTRTVVGPGAGVAIGTVFEESDVFDAVNQFYGGQLGVAAECRAYGFSIEGTLKLALGVNHSRVRIDGSSTATIPVGGGPPIVVNTPAGLLAQSTNIGTYTRDTFAVIPEVGVTIGYNITPRLKITGGYTFFYWTDTLRPGDQIDTNLNLSQLAPGGLVGAPRPLFPGTIDNVWVQGVSAGLEFDF